VPRSIDEEVRQATRSQLIMGVVIGIVGLLLDFYVLSNLGDWSQGRRILGPIGLCLMAVFLTWLGVSTFRDSLRWSMNPDLHPAVCCPRFGTPQQVRQALDQVLNSPDVVRVGPILIAPDWLLLANSAAVESVYIPTVAWCYKQVTEHKRYGVTERISYAFQLYTIDGTSFSRSGISEYDTDQLVRLTSEYAPAAICGHSAELERLWSSDRAEFLRIVAQQHAEWERESRRHRTAANI